MKLPLYAWFILYPVIIFGQTPVENYPVDSASVTHTGVPQGEILHFTFDGSKIFPGTYREYWVYVPFQYKPSKPACVYIGQDGVQFKAPVVFNNLINSQEMPVTIGVFIAPGRVRAANDSAALDRFNRSFEYDGLGDAYARFLLEELLPEVEKQKTTDGRAIVFSKNGNDRAIGGSSSGAVCAFTAAWERPAEFSRVFSSIGTYVNLRGGARYPSLIRKYEPKPLRIFLQDGSNDLNIYAGNWFLANQDMESALSFAGYEVARVWGEGGHNGNHAAAIFPQAMRWLWKDYPKRVAIGISKNPFLNDILALGKSWEPVGGIYAGIVPLETDTKGNVYFTDVKNGKSYLSDTSGIVRLLKTNVTKSVYRNAQKKKSRTKLGFDKSGNRCAIHAKANFYVQAPQTLGGYYATGKDHTPEVGKIFYVNSKAEKTLVDKGLKNPNGLALTPDQTQLYVTESNSHWVWIYNIQPDGKLVNKQQYGWLHSPDTSENAQPGALQCDRDGRVYVATNMGVQILDQVGRVNAILPLPVTQGQVTGLCFGGSDFSEIYVTCNNQIFRRKMKVRGANAFDKPLKPAKPKL